MKHDEAVYSGLSRKEWKEPLSVDLFSVRNQHSCIKRCLGKKAVLLQVQGGSRGFANGTAYAICCCKVKICQQTKQTVQILSPHSQPSGVPWPSTRFLTVMRLAWTSAFFQKKTTLAHAFEKSADGRKKSKERVTINACVNTSGTIKLPLQLIGKANRPRCFPEDEYGLVASKLLCPQKCVADIFFSTGFMAALFT